MPLRTLLSYPMENLTIGNIVIDNTLNQSGYKQCSDFEQFHTETMGVFTWENSHRREFHTGMTFWFRIAFTWWLGHFISRYLKVHFMLIKYTCDSKSQTLRMCYPFQSTGRPISHRNGWSFRVYMILLRDFVPEWNSRPGARTGVNSCWGDSRRHNILWWYHVNKHRAKRGNRSELARGRKSPRCHVNTPYLIMPPFLLVFIVTWYFCNVSVQSCKFLL